MIVLASLIATAAMADDGRLTFQIMITPAYTAFARRADAMCPSRRLRFLHPADLALLEEDFLRALPVQARRRINAADIGWKGCPEAGASCPAQHTLRAIVKTGTLGAFTQSACAAST